MVLKKTISVITAVRNDEKNILKTLNSILRNNYEDIEYIIIDGDSTDNTLKIINNYSKIIDVIISEPDNGLYEAMNKGVEVASGDWIIFMNAGDVFLDRDILNRVFTSNDHHDADILYGDTLVEFPTFRKHIPSGIEANLIRGMQFSHQSVFIRSNYHKKNLYNINNKICADFEFFYKAKKNNVSFNKINENISIVLPGGISDTNRERVFLSWWKVVGYNNIEINILYTWKIVISILKRIVKILLPRSVVYYLIKIGVK